MGLKVIAATMARLRWQVFNEPEGLALDTQGNLYVEDQDNNLIRKINTAGIITTVAGDPATINQGSPAYSGDGGPATKANLALCCGAFMRPTTALLSMPRAICSLEIPGTT